MVQTDTAITKAKISVNDNSGAVGVEVLAVEVVKATVGVLVCVGEELTGLEEGSGTGDEFGEGKFINAVKASFGFPLLSKRPKLESGLSV